MSFRVATDLKIYSGNCNNRTLIASASIANTTSTSTSGFTDSMQVTVSGLTLGNIYLIEVSGNGSGAKNYVLSINSVLTATCSYYPPSTCTPVATGNCEMVLNGSFEHTMATTYNGVAYAAAYNGTTTPITWGNTATAAPYNVDYIYDNPS